MTRVKALNTYPDEYWKIIEGCATQKRVFEATVPSITKALSLQGQFYAFRGALRRAQVQAEAKDPAESTRLAGYIVMAEKTVCWVDRSARQGPTVVRFMHRDATPQAQLLRDFLAHGSTPEIAQPKESEILDSERELLEKLDPDRMERYK